MRLVAVALLTLVVAVIVGVEPSVAPTFRVTFPARPGDFDIAPLRFRLQDFAHVVGGLSMLDPATAGAFSGDGVMRARDQPDAVRINWTGGACEAGVTAVFMKTEHGYRLAMRANPSLLGLPGCPAVGVPRSIELRFKVPIAPDEIFLRSPYGEPNLPEGSRAPDTF